MLIAADPNNFHSTPNPQCAKYTNLVPRFGFWIQLLHNKMNNNKSHFFFLPFFLVSFLQICPNFTAAASSSCPINFTYVETFPWDTSSCRGQSLPVCCQTLHGVFGIGLSWYLNQTSRFYLPDANTSSSCLVDFREKIVSLSISGALFDQCFNDAAEFANGESSCAGIRTVDDWRQKVPANFTLEQSCNGDLTGLVPCGSCLDAGLQVNSHLVSLDRNSTNNKCFFFVCFYVAAIVNDFGPENLGVAICALKVPISTKADAKKSIGRTATLISGIVGGLSGVFFTVFVFLAYKKWSRKKKEDTMLESFVLSVKTKVLPNTGARWFRIAELERATDGFSDKNIIGRGGFGVVYRGVLSDGAEVAVKRVLDLDSKGDEEFTNEAQIISKIRHRNLLSLRGFCVTNERFKGKRRYLVYDFMSNGSLDDHLFNTNGSWPHLTWAQRKNIIIDIARGLVYLHDGIKPSIYHRDVKATNILLDSDMRAKVADFGLAKQNDAGERSHVTTRVAGTHGYLAPEYAMYGHLTEKADVYSFGILILEILSSTRALDGSEPSSKRLIADRVWELVKSERIEEAFHESVREEGPGPVMERFVRVGILCAHVMVAFRPTMGEALRMLDGDVEVPELPDRPVPLSQEVMETSFRYSSTSTMSLGSRDQSSISSSTI